jgi:predicted DCC family thiol-disulfide oxidoreductase YuxK
MYNQLNVDFAVDEKLETWQNIYSWMRSIASPESFEERKRLAALQNQYKQTPESSYSDATLTVLNNLNNPTIRVQFINAFPVMLADIVFDTKMSADDIMYSTVTFQYDYYNFIPV